MTTTRETAEAPVGPGPGVAEAELPVAVAAEDDEPMFAMTADLTLARQSTRPGEAPDAPDADGVIALPTSDLVVVTADDPRRETVDDPRIPPDKLFFKIGEVSKLTGVKPYVLRYWETEFPWIRPSKTSSGQRLYRRQDIGILLEIRRLRHEEHRTIADTKEHIRERRGQERTRRPSKPPRKVSTPPPALLESPLAAESVPPIAARPHTSPVPGAPPPHVLTPLLRELRREVTDLLAFVDGHARA